MSENVVVRYPDPPPPRWVQLLLRELLIVAMAFASGWVWCGVHVAR